MTGEHDPPASQLTPRSAPQLVAPEDRLPLLFVPRPHPATWPSDKLLDRCQLRTQSRSGPGGQHRNRTASGAFLTFDFEAIGRPATSEIAQVGTLVAEATEGRQQSRNRDTALRRLRFQLAIALRTDSPLDQVENENGIADWETQIRSLYSGGDLKLSDRNEDKPAVIALILNDFHAAGGQPSLIAPLWRATTSRLIAILRSHLSALTLANQIRRHHNRPPLH